MVGLSRTHDFFVVLRRIPNVTLCEQAERAATGVLSSPCFHVRSWPSERKALPWSTYALPWSTYATAGSARDIVRDIPHPHVHRVSIAE